MPRLRFLRQMIFDGQGDPADPIARPDPARWASDEITGACLGHSTVLLNFFGIRILTDPVFSRRVGLRFGPLVLGPKRRVKPAIDPDTIAPPDVIVLSHAHFDHFDVPSLRRFPRSTPIVTAKSTRDLLRALRFTDIRELEWENSATITARGESLTLTAVPVAHWGARLMRDLHRGYNGYLFERRGRRVLFGGDTAHTQTFAQLNDPRRPIDLALMPIGAYDPWIRAHCTPEQAASMAADAGATYFVPVHHETFKLSNEPMDEPARRIRAAFADRPERLLATHVGETFVVPRERKPPPGPLRTKPLTEENRPVTSAVRVAGA